MVVGLHLHPAPEAHAAGDAVVGQECGLHFVPDHDPWQAPRRAWQAPPATIPLAGARDGAEAALPEALADVLRCAGLRRLQLHDLRYYFVSFLPRFDVPPAAAQ